jgi:putative ABC transport system permease protein
MFFESIRLALDSLAANKLRAVLTMLGIIIGVGAVITLMAAGEGVQELIKSEIQGIGSNLLFVVPNTSGSTRTIGASLGRSSPLSYSDALALADPFNAPDIIAVAPEYSRSGQVVFGNKNRGTNISGVTPAYSRVRNTFVELGDFITEQDLASASRVCVLGPVVAEKLFGSDIYPIGQTIKINRIPFRVIGVLETKGGSGFGNRDDIILVPLTTAVTRLFKNRTSRGEYPVSVIYAQVSQEDRVDAAISQISEVLRQRHKITFRNDDDFLVVNQADILDIFGRITGVLTIFLGAIAAISLLVGGIGIMNIMLVSVTERTREIGIRKAVGAKRRNILTQFLIEATTLSLIGGLLGVLLGYVGSRAVAYFAPEITPAVTWNAVLLATGFALAVGLFFGIYPATRAAKLNPIDALRYE